MLNILKTSNKLQFLLRASYHFNDPHFGKVHHQVFLFLQPGLTAKRIINCIQKRLVQIDPDRWTGVPFSFKTHWRDEDGNSDIYTSIHVHDALERQFGIEIKDRQILVTDIQTAFYIVLQNHDSL